MVDTSQIQEHMEVVANDGQHIGTVDHLDGQKGIKLTKNDLHRIASIIGSARLSSPASTTRSTFPALPTKQCGKKLLNKPNSHRWRGHSCPRVELNLLRDNA